MDIDFNKIKAVQMEEKETKSPTKVHPEFYKWMKEFLEKEKERIEKKLTRVGTDFKVEELYEYQNLVELMKEIILIRSEKIVKMAVTDAVFGKDSSLEGLTDWEKDLYRYVRNVVEDAVHYVLGEGKRFKDTVFVRILRDVPSIVGPYGKVYGPFRSGEELPLPKQIAEILIKEGYAEVVE